MDPPHRDSEVMKLKARLYDIQCENAELGLSLNDTNKQLTEKETLLRHAMAHIEKEAGRMYEIQRENAELREKLDITTQQLAESKSLLSRAMEHIERETVNERERVRLSSLAPTSPNIQRQCSPAPVSPLAKERQTTAWSKSVRPHDNNAANRQSEPVHSPRPGPSTSPRPGHRRSAPMYPPRPGPSTSPRPGGHQEHIRRIREQPRNLTRDELGELVVKPEPQRYYDWMRAMFITNIAGEVDQPDLWHLYKETFAPFAQRYPLLGAADVINLVQEVFPEARTMIVEEPVKRYIVRGLDRRKECTIGG